jgi:putative ABC transport system ATP-binding protein
MPRRRGSDERPAVARAQRFLQARQERAAQRASEAAVSRPRPRSSRAGVPVIDLRDVHKTYSVGDIAVHALRGVSLRIERGEYVAIVGASGSGKTTLMNILGCLDTPTSGVYRLNGLDVRGIDEDSLADVRNREIGFVFQSFNLIPRTRAQANVELPLAYAGLTRGARHERAVTALRQVGLGNRVHHIPSELSGGQQQRVAIARALVTRPTILFADEPTGNLDSKTGGEILELLRDSARDYRQTIVMVTHEVRAAAIADRVMFLADGLIVKELINTDAATVLEVIGTLQS